MGEEGTKTRQGHVQTKTKAAADEAVNRKRVVRSSDGDVSLIPYVTIVGTKNRVGFHCLPLRDAVFDNSPARQKLRKLRADTGLEDATENQHFA